MILPLKLVFSDLIIGIIVTPTEAMCSTISRYSPYLEPALERMLIKLEPGCQSRSLSLPGFQLGIEQPVIVKPVDHGILLVVLVRTFDAQKYSAR